MKYEDVYELYQRGMALLGTRNPEAAAVVLKRAALGEPARSSIREALGRAYFASGRYGLAAREFKEVVELYPTNDYAHFCLAKCAEKLGDEKLFRRHSRLAAVMGYEDGS